MGLELDPARARPVLRMMVGRALDTVTERATAERVAHLVTLVVGARRMGLRFGLWHTQNHVFALWRDQPQAHEVLRPLVDVLGLALASGPPRK